LFQSFTQSNRLASVPSTPGVPCGPVGPTSPVSPLRFSLTSVDKLSHYSITSPIVQIYLFLVSSQCQAIDPPARYPDLSFRKAADPFPNSADPSG